MSRLSPPNGDSDGGLGDGAAAVERQQTLADTDQTLSDCDQTTADSDQTVSDLQQVASDSDQAASDSDQAASDRDFVGGGDADVHRFSRELRERNAETRFVSSTARAHAAVTRDRLAHARDLAALERDEAAAQRDRELAARDAAAAVGGRAVAKRERAAADRAAAAEARVRAAADREQAARDRQLAARDRLRASVDREALLAALAIAETDALTGTHTRAAGLTGLEREIDRARRSGGRLAVAYVDVVALKQTNDTYGHAAGDALLQRVVSAIREHLRSYDLIVRLGGDEFLCVMAGADAEHIRGRFAAVQARLAAEPDPDRIKAGFAALEPDDGAAELIARADHAMPRSPGS